MTRTSQEDSLQQAKNAWNSDFDFSSQSVYRQGCELRPFDLYT